jgi:hypothetical protein
MSKTVRWLLPLLLVGHFFCRLQSFRPCRSLMNAQSESREDLTFAAGGLLRRAGPDGQEIASQNQYFKMALLARQVKIQLAFLVVLVAGVGVLIGAGFVAVRETAGAVPSAKVFTLAAVVLLGMLGASLSVLYSLVKTTVDQRIPEQLASDWITFARPFIGAASALVAYVLFGAGLVSIGQTSTPALLALAFISGFSERYVTGVIASAVGGSK